MSKKTWHIVLTLSVLALINVMFVPLMSIYDGLFPDESSIDFFETMESIFTDGNWREYLSARFTLYILIPSVVMLAFALFEVKSLFIASTVVGILLWSYGIYSFADELDGIGHALNVEHGAISIGAWIAVALFFACFLVAVCAENPSMSQTVIIQSQGYPIQPPNAMGYNNYQNQQPNGMGYNNYQGQQPNGMAQNGYDGGFNNIPTTPYEGNYCPECGTQNEQNAAFCGICGHKF